MMILDMERIEAMVMNGITTDRFIFKKKLISLFESETIGKDISKLLTIKRMELYNAVKKATDYAAPDWIKRMNKLENMIENDYAYIKLISDSLPESKKFLSENDWMSIYNKLNAFCSVYSAIVEMESEESRVLFVA